MNKGNQSYLIGAVVFLSIAFATLTILYLNKNKASAPTNQNLSLTTVPSIINKPTIPKGPRKGQKNYQEAVTQIAIGTEGVTKGMYQKVENGEIYISTNADIVTKLALSQDEVAITCTKQNLTSATELDFNQVTKVEVATPANLDSKIEQNESVVLFAQQIEGINRVHTIALPEESCSK